MTQTNQRSPTPHTTANDISRRTWLAMGLFALGLGATLVALLGPLVAEAIRFHLSDGAVSQVIGGDVAGLFLVAPVSVLAGALVWRRHRAVPVLALGPFLYALYMYSQLALGRRLHPL